MGPHLLNIRRKLKALGHRSDEDKVELAELTELFEAVAAAARKGLVEPTR